MIAPENAFLVFGSHATKKKMHEVSRERMDLGRYINNLNTVLSDQQQKKKPFICSLSLRVCFLKVVHLWRFFFISSHFFSLISSFQADLFGPWGGGGAFAPIAPPCLRACVHLRRSPVFSLWFVGRTRFCSQLTKLRFNRL